MNSITVREYARLTTSEVVATLDQHTVTESAFKYLCELSARFSRAGAALVQMEDRLSLRLDNFVGVVETPCGTILEILPKHVDHHNDARWARKLLRKMLLSALDLTTRDAGAANIELFKSPLTEWVIRRFLQTLDHLVKRGIRFDYLRVEEEQRFLRGQLDISKQMRQPPGRQHFFQIRHDVFLPDRPENRLLKSALDKVCKHTQEAGNWRLAHELACLLAEIPASTQPASDFRAWRNSRLMAPYQSVKPWCELVLGEHMPLALKGSSHGISLLFPMEKLFERYVAAGLRQALTPNTRLDTQVTSKSLCVHEGKGFFQLRPDVMLTAGAQVWILDTKWKLLDENRKNNDDGDGKAKYGLSQSDFYQLFAYGHKYLEGTGDLVLIYPKTAEFGKALPVFKFSNQLNLWVVPFDLDTKELVPSALALPLITRDIKALKVPGSIRVHDASIEVPTLQVA